MKLRNFFLITLLLSLGFVFAACDDDDDDNNNNNNVNTSCGNGIIETGEDCDGTEFNGVGCSDLLGEDYGGTMACDPVTCTYITDGCEEKVCGDGVIQGDEECDGDDFGDATCETIGDNSGGTLSCTDLCIIDDSQCVPNCNVEGFMEDCNSMGGEYECCPSNGFPGECVTGWTDGGARCMQTCGGDEECGWSMTCSANVANHCYYGYCGEGNEGTPINEGCSLGTKDGWCYPLWRAMDDAGLCFENGTVEHLGACERDDDNPIEGTLDVDPDTQCNEGICITDGTTTTGECVSYCDPVDAYETGNGGCPDNWNCVNYSSIDFDETFSDGSTNPNVLFREADYGICFPMQDGLSTNLDEALVTCDLVDGETIKDGGSCPTGEACKYIVLGNLIGGCSEVQATPLTIGETCSLPSDETTPYQCEAGLQCFIADPFNDANPSDPAMACAQICDANEGLEGNSACAGLTTTDGSDYVCLTTSRFFTNDLELPTTGTGLNAETESSPSRLGFCVPPLASSN